MPDNIQTEIFLRNYPLLKLTIAYISGIIIVEFTPSPAICLYSCLSLMLFTLILHLFFNLKTHYRRFITRGVLVYLVFVFTGMLNYQLSQRFNSLPSGKLKYTGIITAAPVAKENSIQTDCRILSLGKKNNETRINEKVRLYLEPDTLLCTPNIGDSIFFTGRLDEIRNPGNPGEFDYARYMKYQGIHYSGYIKKTDYSLGKNSGKFKIRRLSAQIQDRLIAWFEKYNIRNNELAVLSALTAGNRNYLEQELRERYAAVGAMHILAVSGLHVGILYLFLILIFGNRNQKRYYKFIRTVVILTVIWMYAFITGLSSSVLRAALMFSLFIIGKNQERQVNSYNILAASALLILLITPFELFKVGFQFSYLAVLGIIYFQPKFEKLVFFRQGISDRIWQLFTVSFAAQITTVPLSLYYFHQFPVYFWLTNILIIPLVWLIMAGTLIFCIALPFSFLLHFISIALNMLLKVLNLSVRIIGELPFSTLSEIRFNTVHLITLYLFLILLIVIITQKYYRFVPRLIGLLIIVFLLENIISMNKISGKKELIIYTDRNHNFILSLIDGMNHTLITKGVDSMDTDNTMRYLKNYWVSAKINHDKHWISCENQFPGKVFQSQNLEIKYLPEGFLINFYNTRCLYLKNFEDRNFETTLSVSNENILIVGSDSHYPVKDLYEIYNPTLIIACNSLTWYERNTWESFAGRYGIEYFSLSDKGAYRKNNFAQ